MCHGLELQCRRQRNRNALPEPEIEVTRGLSILRNTQEVTPLLGLNAINMRMQ